MRLDLDVTASLAEQLEKEIVDGERAVTRVMQRAAKLLKDSWRQDVEGAGLGGRLAKTIRGDAFPRGGASLNAAALVYTKAPVIIDAHETGPLIRSKD
ncbi:DUF6441 family protein, partial [Seohaeicola nanhaiensis]